MAERLRDEKGRLLPNTKGQPPLPPSSSVDVTYQPRPGDDQPSEPRNTVKTVSRDKPFLMDDDWLYVTNQETYPVEFRWARKHYVCQPGETIPVLFQALVNKLGDPRSVDGAQQNYDDGNGNHGKIMERYDYLKSLFAYYGVEEERLETFTRPDGRTIQGLYDVVPKVAVTTFSGQPVQFPCYDKDMLAFPVANANKRAVNSDVTRMMESLEAENDALRGQVETILNRLDAMTQAQQGTEAD
jgi:hypothetical protein